VIRVHDSHTGEEFPGHNLYAVAYEPLWQTIRHGMRWSALDNVRSNIVTLEAYVGRSPDAQETACRLFRMKILLAAVPVGKADKHGFHVIERAAQPFIIAYQEQLATRYDMAEEILEWDWHKARVQAHHQWQHNGRLLFTIYRYLKVTRGRRAKPKSALRYYLSILEEVTLDFNQFPT